MNLKLSIADPNLFSSLQYLVDGLQMFFCELISTSCRRLFCFMPLQKSALGSYSPLLHLVYELAILFVTLHCVINSRRVLLSIVYRSWLKYVLFCDIAEISSRLVFSVVFS